MDRFKADANQFNDELDRALGKFELINNFSQQTKVKRTYFGYGAIGLLVLCVWLNVCSHLIVDLIGFAYPFFKSMEMLEKLTRDDKQWITYWVIYGFFGLIEYNLNALLAHFPTYFLFKCAVLLYLMAPGVRGGYQLYIYALHPLFSMINGTHPPSQVYADAKRKANETYQASANKISQAANTASESLNSSIESTRSAARNATDSFTTSVENSKASVKSAIGEVTSSQ